MAGLRTRIKSLYNSFSSAQQRVADHVLSQGQDIPFLSVHELAAATGVSVASVSRFARELGYARYKDFKTALGKDSLSAVETVYESIAPDDTDQRIIEKVFAGNIRSLEETLGIVARRDVIRAAKALSSANRIVFFGIGSSGYIAGDAALRFSQLNLQATAYNDSYGIMNQSLGLAKGDVAVGISHSGRSNMTIYALERASSQGAITIGLSNYMKSPLEKVSRFFLCSSFPESHVKVAALSSRIAQMCLIDALYLLTARNMKAPLRKAEALNAAAEDILRRSMK